MKPILIIDNDRDIRESLEDSLADEGYVTAEASNGREALAYLRANDVSLILLDWNMARIDAPAFMAELANEDRLREVPVVLLTADARASFGSLPGYAATLTKPVDLNKLFELAVRYCGQPDAS